jgi:cellulose synthase/poly-beta-1,6-N-acetylglucosamine synthase-like glycosyltransferase
MSLLDPIAIAYWVSLICLAHTWSLYWIILFLCSRLAKWRHKSLPAGPPGPLPSISFIVAARNEEGSIGGRIENLRELAKGASWVEVLVASDGSKDGTCMEVRKFQETWPGVRLLDFQIQRGRSAVHNDAVKEARGEILVFTDAETRFDAQFLEHVLPRFRDPQVGAVSGRIHYTNLEDSSVTLSAGLYWELEERLRTMESQLGILAFGTGAALCMRRELYLPMPTQHDDVDYWETLSLAGRGFRVEYEPRAKAYDTICPSLTPTHRVRARRTSMAFRSMLNAVVAFRLWRRPGVMFSVISHKLLRHLSPFLLLVLMGSNILVAGKGKWYGVSLLAQGLMYGSAVLGWIAHLKGLKLKPLAIPFNFVLLNFSRLLGVAQALTRRPPSTYR